MTSKSDWEFRSDVLRSAAKAMRERAAELIRGAESLEQRALACEAMAVSSHERQP